MQRHRQRQHTFVAVVFVSIMSTSVADAQSSYGINVEASGLYNQSGCWGGPLSNPPIAANNFLDKMLSVSTYPFYRRNKFTESGGVYNVWSSDFYDPERTGDTTDHDEIYFDGQGSAISYYFGHGACAWVGDTNVSCYHNSSCDSSFSRSAGSPIGTLTRSSFGTPPFTSTSGFCRRDVPGSSVGRCSYPMWNSRALAVSDCNHSIAEGGTVFYGGGDVKWGEGLSVGNWGGAGKNGGTHVVVLEASCASMTGRQNEIWPAFAGVHFLATTLVHQGDAYISTTRGQNWAQEYVSHPTASAAYAWLTAATNEPANPSYPCVGSAGVSYGSGAGINGCGGHAIDALGASSAEASSLLAQNWSSITYDWAGGAGNAYWNSRYQCNWNCSYWTVDLP